MSVKVKSEQSQGLEGRMLMGAAAVQQALDCSKSTLRRLVLGELSPEMRFPHPTRALGTRSNYWIRAEVEAWLAARLAAPAE
jgi:predicted DNA-binding transcriptional regulator AlpA